MRAVAELPAADEALVERSDDAERAQARAAAEQQQTEVLVCRPNRTRAAAERQQTELFQFTGALRDRATGTRWSRKRPRPAAAPCADSCQQEDCKRARAERDEALRVASAAQEQLDAVRAEMALLVEGLEGDDKSARFEAKIIIFARGATPRTPPFIFHFSL